MYGHAPLTKGAFYQTNSPLSGTTKFQCTVHINQKACAPKLTPTNGAKPLVLYIPPQECMVNVHVKVVFLDMP